MAFVNGFGWWSYSSPTICLLHSSSRAFKLLRYTNDVTSVNVLYSTAIEKLQNTSKPKLKWICFTVFVSSSTLHTILGIIKSFRLAENISERVTHSVHSHFSAVFDVLILLLQSFQYFIINFKGSRLDYFQRSIRLSRLFKIVAHISISNGVN